MSPVNLDLAARASELSPAAGEKPFLPTPNVVTEPAHPVAPSKGGAEGASAAAVTGDGTATAAATATEELTQLQERLGGIMTGALTANLIVLGDRLGLYAGLKEHGPCTAAQLANSLDMSERYIAEWLSQQASARIISTDEVAEKFWLTPTQQDCLVHESGSEASPNFFIGGLSSLPGLSRLADERLPTCFKTGEGISYNDVNHGITCGVCRELGVWARHALLPSLCGLPGMREKLDQGCLVADVGCGCGEALMVCAAAWPASTFHGYDISEEALSEGRAEAARRGLANVQFFNPGEDEQRMLRQGPYQLVMTHDAVHDMAYPSRVTATVRRAVADDGCWIIGDMSSLDSHAANVHQHPLAPLLYGFSVHLCLPSGLSAPGGEGLGTLGISTGKMRSMLMDAGFGSVEVLDWQHPLNRYYIAKP